MMVWLIFITLFNYQNGEQKINVDIQYCMCISRHKVVEYCAKYSTKCEPRSQSLKEVYSQGLQDNDKSLKAVQKLLINGVAQHDYSTQETCHHLLQLYLFTMHQEIL